jgi:hypothetical protein
VQVWRYGWTIAPLIATVALGTALVLNRFVWVGWVAVAIGCLGLLLVLLKEIVERPERANAFYRVDGPQATYLYSYAEFRRLPGRVRSALLKDPDVVAWFKRETSRHGGDMLAAYGTSFGKMRYRFYLWVIDFLT